MDLTLAFEELDKNTGSIPKGEIETARQVIERGPTKNGKFPISLGTITWTSSLLQTSVVRPEKLVSYLLTDPVATVRLLSLVNHSFYNRGHEISSVNRAITHVGLMSLGRVLEDLGEAKSYNAVFLGRATAAIELQKTILASFIAKHSTLMFAKDTEIGEKAAAAAAVYGLVPLMLAYFKPNIHAGICLDAEASKKLQYQKIVRRVLGDSITDIAAKVANELGLPAQFANYMLLSDLPPWNRRSWGQKSAQETRMVVSSAYLGRTLAECLFSFQQTSTYSKLVRDSANKLRIDPTSLEAAVAEAIAEFYLVCSDVGLKPLRLPRFIVKRALDVTAESDEGEPAFIEPKLNERINPFLYELKASFKAERTTEEFRRLPQVVYCTLNALTHALPFDRAILMSAEESRGWLKYAASHGHLEEEEKNYLKRAFNSPNSEHMPDLKAHALRKPVFSGDPLFEGHWPFAAFPVIWHDEVIGVFYADKKETKDAKPLDTQEQVALIALAEQWHEVPPEFC